MESSMTKSGTNRAMLTALLALFALPATAAVGDYEKQTGGIVLQTGDGSLRIQLIASNIARVTFARSAILFTRSASAVLPNSVVPKWTLADTNGELVLATANLKMRVDRKTGRVSFLD